VTSTNKLKKPSRSKSCVRVSGNNSRSRTLQGPHV